MCLECRIVAVLFVHEKAGWIVTVAMHDEHPAAGLRARLAPVQKIVQRPWILLQASISM
jgi:hypothetical protein